MFEFVGALLEPHHFALIIGGLIAGAVVGCLPGLTATMALALLVPFTFAMDPTSGLIILGAVYVGAIYGGCISAILIGTPGTPSAIATTFDGYPLTKKGMAEHALVTAAFGSSIGGLIGAFGLLLLSPILVSIALKFGPPEYFWLAVLGLTVIATLSSKSLIKGLIGGTLGLLMGTVGIAPIGGDVRFTFGFTELQAGFDLIVALIGLFCLPEVIEMMERRKVQLRIAEYKKKKGVALAVVKQLLKKPILLIRSAVIGLIVGIIPGAGGNIAGLLSYDIAVKSSKEPEKFGTGIIEGVAASETSNNAEVGGSLVPLLTLGIPGAPPAAVMLGALMIHGLRPGPDLFSVSGDIVYTFMYSLIIANILLFFVGFYGARIFAKLISLPVYALVPFIIFLCVIGSYSIRNNMLDVYAMVGFGIFGYFTKKLGIHPGTIVLGLILGRIAEIGFVQSILLSKAIGSYWAVFIARPISAILIILCAVMLLWPVFAGYFKKEIPTGEGD